MNNIKILREQKKLSMAETARMLRIPYTTYINYEKGEREPNSEMLVKIANFFQVSVDYLIGREKEYDKNYPIVASDTVLLPVIGSIAAGYEQIAVEDWTGETIEIPQSYIRGYKKEDFFVLTVKGDSMFPTYQEGDKVVILKQNALEHSGSVCAVLYNDDMATLKRVDIIGAKIKLTPLNHNYAPKTITGTEKKHFRIIGIPKVLIREIEE